MQYSKQQHHVKQGYENYSTCSCGKPARHANGLCWSCYDLQPYSYYAQSRASLYERLVELGLEWDKGSESAEDYKQRCREYFNSRLKGRGLGSLVGSGKGTNT